MLKKDFSLNGLYSTSTRVNRFYPEAAEIGKYVNNNIKNDNPFDKSKNKAVNEDSDYGLTAADMKKMGSGGAATIDTKSFSKPAGDLGSKGSLPKEDTISTVGSMNPVVQPQGRTLSTGTVAEGDHCKKCRKPLKDNPYFHDLLDLKKTGKINNYTSFLLHPDKATPDDIEGMSRSAQLLGKQDNIDDVMRANHIIPFSGDLNLVNPSSTHDACCFYSKPKNKFYIKRDGEFPLDDNSFTTGGMDPEQFAGYWKNKYFYVPELDYAEKAIESFYDGLFDSEFIEGTDSFIRSMMDFIVTPSSERGDRDTVRNMREYASNVFSEHVPVDTQLFMVEKACNLVKLKLMKENGIDDMLISDTKRTGIFIEKDLRNSNGYDFVDMKDTQDELNKTIYRMVREYQDMVIDNVAGMYMEAADIAPRMKPIIAKLNQKGYKTKYSSPGYGDEIKKGDHNDDKVYYSKLYSTARLQFDKVYNFPKPPKHWVMRVVNDSDGKPNSYLDVIQPWHKDNKPSKEEFTEWREAYMKSLENWVDGLAPADETKDGVDPDAERANKRILEAAANPYVAFKYAKELRNHGFDNSNSSPLYEHCINVVNYWKLVTERVNNGEYLDDVDEAWYEGVGAAFKPIKDAIDTFKKPIEEKPNEINGYPLRGVGRIKFGMKRDKLNKLFPYAKPFRKGKSSKMTDDLGWCHVFYDASDKCIAVEVFNDITVKVNGKVLIPGDINDAATVFPDLVKDKGDYVSYKKSVGISESGDKIKSICFGKRGYYNEPKAVKESASSSKKNKLR